MKINKKEIILLILLGVIAYGFIIYKFIYVPITPRIQAAHDSIKLSETRIEQLNKDIVESDLKKLNLSSNQAQNERMSAYLPNAANAADCMAYTNKLSEMFNQKITNISVSAPAANEINGVKYYTYNINFSTTLPLDRITDLFQYIENSARVAKINTFTINKAASEEGKDEYSLTINISLYAMNVSEGSALDQFSSHKFNNYTYSDSPVFGGKISSVSDAAVQVAQPSSEDSNKKANLPADFHIQLYSALFAGDNFKIYGPDKNINNFSLKTNKLITIELTIDEDNYKLTYSDGKTSKQFTGDTPKRDLLMLTTDIVVPEIDANKDLAGKLIITNNTSKKLMVIAFDKAKKLMMIDRDGNSITNSQNKENVLYS